MGSTGVEGDRDDDWQLVDCHEFLVQLMLPGKRCLSYRGNYFDIDVSVVYRNKESDRSGVSLVDGRETLCSLFQE